MGRKNKLFKFSEVLSFPNVVENFDYLDPRLIRGHNQEVDYKGQWSSAFFNNDQDIIIELACGRGEYSLALGQAYPQKNFIGIDIKGARIWKGAKAAIDQGLTNVGFLRTRIEQTQLFFGENEVSEIWITFPDPFLMKERNRLTHHRFLDQYSPFLKNGGFIHLKTDDLTLYEFSIESFNSWGNGQVEFMDDDIYGHQIDNIDLAHKTYYETKHLALGKTIKYIKYRFQK